TRILHHLDSLRCRLIMSPLTAGHSSEPFLPNNFRVSKTSYAYSSYSALKRRMKLNQQSKISTAIIRCCSNVRTILSCNNFHRRILCQYTTTLITEHGPTREFPKRHVIDSDLCPSCLVTESYSH